MSEAKKGDLVQIHKTILKPDQRPDTLPTSSRSVDYECWIKGFLLEENARVGDAVRIETFIGRELSGTLYQVNPIYDHNFGAPQKEILAIGNEVKRQIGKKP